MMVTFVSQCEKHALKEHDVYWMHLLTVLVITHGKPSSLKTAYKQSKNAEAKRQSQYCCKLSLDTLSITLSTLMGRRESQ